MCLVKCLEACRLRLLHIRVGKPLRHVLMSKGVLRRQEAVIFGMEAQKTALGAKAWNDAAPAWAVALIPIALSRRTHVHLARGAR